MRSRHCWRPSRGTDSAEASLTAWEPANAASDESESGHAVSEHSGAATFETASASGDAVEVEVAESASESSVYSAYGSSASATDDADAADASDVAEVEIVEEAGAPVAAAAVATAAVTPVTSAASMAEPVAPAVSQEQLEAVVRKVLGEMTDRLLQEMRETVSSRVVDVAERLVREEIERLKAAAEADQA